jgi:hypothetical protein
LAGSQAGLVVTDDEPAAGGVGAGVGALATAADGQAAAAEQDSMALQPSPAKAPRRGSQEAAVFLDLGVVRRQSQADAAATAAAASQGLALGPGPLFTKRTAAPGEGTARTDLILLSDRGAAMEDTARSAAAAGVGADAAAASEVATNDDNDNDATTASSVARAPSPAGPLTREQAESAAIADMLRPRAMPVNTRIVHSMRRGTRPGAGGISLRTLPSFRAVAQVAPADHSPSPSPSRREQAYQVTTPSPTQQGDYESESENESPTRGAASPPQRRHAPATARVATDDTYESTSVSEADTSNRAQPHAAAAGAAAGSSPRRTRGAAARGAGPNPADSDELTDLQAQLAGVLAREAAQKAALEAARAAGGGGTSPLKSPASVSRGRPLMRSSSQSQVSPANPTVPGRVNSSSPLRNAGARATSGSPSPSASPSRVGTVRSVRERSTSRSRSVQAAAGASSLEGAAAIGPGGLSPVRQRSLGLPAEANPPATTTARARTESFQELGALSPKLGPEPSVGTPSPTRGSPLRSGLSRVLGRQPSATAGVPQASAVDEEALAGINERPSHSRGSGGTTDSEIKIVAPDSGLGMPPTGSPSLRQAATSLSPKKQLPRTISGRQVLPSTAQRAREASPMRSRSPAEPDDSALALAAATGTTVSSNDATPATDASSAAWESARAAAQAPPTASARHGRPLGVASPGTLSGRLAPLSRTPSSSAVLTTERLDAALAQFPGQPGQPRRLPPLPEPSEDGPADVAAVVPGSAQVQAWS